MELFVTYDATSLVNTAITKATATFTAWYAQVCAMVGIAPIANPTDYFSGAQSFKTFLAQLQSASYSNAVTGSQINILEQAYSAAVNLTNVKNFMALAPSTAQMSFETWMWINNIANSVAPTPQQLGLL